MLLEIIGAYYLINDIIPFEFFGFSGRGIILRVGFLIILSSVFYPLYELNKSEKTKK